MFTKIVYINLDRRIDRKEHILKEITKINKNNEMEVERISAIDWKTLDFLNLSRDLFTEEAINTALNNMNGKYDLMTKGGIGCALSHKNVYEKILNSNHEYTLILEDDFTFNENFMLKLREYLKEIQNYDILWLGYHGKDFKKTIRQKCYDNPDKKLYGTFGYIINKKAAKELLTIFPLTKQIDSEIPKIFPQLNVYSLKTSNKLILTDGSFENKFGTDIQII